MKKIICIALCLFVGLIALSACKKQEEPVQFSTPTPVVTPEPTPEPTVVAEESAGPQLQAEGVATVVPGYSSLSGKPYTGEYKPIIVMIENSPAARPQTGLQVANVVYECLTEGSVTRFMCVFNDEMPESVGPVRSSRLYFIKLAHEWGDAIYAHYGGNHNKNCAANIYDFINKYPFKLRIDGIGNDHGTTFRSSDRKAPHNAYINLGKARALYNYDPSFRPFAFTSEETYEGATPATEVSIRFLPRANNTQYKYDAEKKVYLRSSDGKEHKDSLTNKQIEVKNILIQMAPYKLIYKQTHDADVIGSGEAMLITNGQVKKLQWERADMKSRTVFFDPETKKEVSLQVGNTWIHVVPTDGAVEVK